MGTTAAFPSTPSASTALTNCRLEHGKAFLAHTNGLVNRLVSGWNASGFSYWRSGLYFSPFYSARGSNTILAPGKNGILPADQRQAARWFDVSVNRADLGQPYNGETFIRRTALASDFLNNIPRNYMTGPGFYNIDSSFFKITPITERVKLRLEAQIFNLLNHKNFGLPNNAGVINLGVGPAAHCAISGEDRLLAIAERVSRSESFPLPRARLQRSRPRCWRAATQR